MLEHSSLQLKKYTLKGKCNSVMVTCTESETEQNHSEVSSIVYYYVGVIN